MAIRPDDALARRAWRDAARRIAAAHLRRGGRAGAQKLAVCTRTRVELIARRSEVRRTLSQLGAARVELDQLLAMKVAGGRRGQSRNMAIWQARLDAAANEAQSLESLLAQSRGTPQRAAGQGIVVVAARNAHRRRFAARFAAAPAVGPGAWSRATEAGGVPRAPASASFRRPALRSLRQRMSQVLFAGPYHKNGQVLILERAGGYDLVLAGLERVDVRPGDQLLAGEPVGRMPRTGAETRLYFELRQNGKGVSPAPWLDVDLRKAKKIMKRFALVGVGMVAGFAAPH